MSSERFQRLLKQLAFRSVDSQTQYVNDFFGELFIHLFAKDGYQRRFIAGEYDTVYRFVFDGPFEHVNNFLGVMQMIIFQMPLVPTLRPAANLCSLRLHVLYFFAISGLAGGKYHDLCPIGVSQNYRIAAILID